MRPNGRRWEETRSKQRIERVDVHQVEGEPCFLGVDSGSTTSKVVVIDQRGRVMFTHYTNNNGNAIRATQEGMRKAAPVVRRLCSSRPMIARSRRHRLWRGPDPGGLRPGRGDRGDRWPISGRRKPLTRMCLSSWILAARI